MYVTCTYTAMTKGAELSDVWLQRSSSIIKTYTWWITLPRVGLNGQHFNPTFGTYTNSIFKELITKWYDSVHHSFTHHSFMKWGIGNRHWNLQMNYSFSQAREYKWFTIWITDLYICLYKSTYLIYSTSTGLPYTLDIICRLNVWSALVLVTYTTHL